MREPFRRARLFLTTLLVIEIILGATIILVTALYHFMLGSFLADTEHKMLNGQFFNTYLLGLQLIVVYSCSLCLWWRLWAKRCTPNVALIVKVWLAFCFLIAICGFGTVWSLLMCARAIENLAEMSLLKGIDLYYTCPEWKLLWDGLQFHRECCGVHNYKDWMKASWMPADPFESLDEDQEPQCDKQVTLAPYACCKHTCNACFENYVPSSGSSGIPYLNMTQININGCLEQFSNSMWTIVYILLFLVLVAFKIDLMICCAAKYILRKQDMADIGYCNKGMTDENCQPMVVIKCPPNVRCCAVTEEDGSAVIPNENREGMVDPCSCFSEIKRQYAIKQETIQVPFLENPTQQEHTRQQPPKKRNSMKPRFVH